MNKSEVSNTPYSIASNLLGWLFGLLFFAFGLVNLFWGNNPGFGVFIIILSCVYMPPVNAMFYEKTGLHFPWYLKVPLGMFIFWVVLGVGELFSKIDLMMIELSLG